MLGNEKFPCISPTCHFNVFHFVMHCIMQLWKLVAMVELLPSLISDFFIIPSALGNPKLILISVTNLHSVVEEKPSRKQELMSGNLEFVNPSDKRNWTIKAGHFHFRPEHHKVRGKSHSCSCTCESRDTRLSQMDFVILSPFLWGIICWN